MNLPLTISYANRVINQDGTVSLVAVLKDNANTVLSTSQGVFQASEPVSTVISWLTGIVRGYLESNLTAADIPLNASISYGIPAGVRPIDLML